MNRPTVFSIAMLMATLCLSACGGDDASTGGNDAEPDAGGDTAVDVAADPDAATDAVDRGTDRDEPGDDVTLFDSGDADQPDPGDDVLDDLDDDLATSDTADLSDTGGSGFPTLFDYRPCDVDVDCPVGLGNCITEIPLNREDPELGTRVDVLDLIPEGLIPDWPADGVCSLACTTDVTACEVLTLRDSLGREVPWSCHLVVEGDSPYPELVPPFPFDDQLDADGMAAGVPFGAICRPPFELDRDRSAGFCQACEGDGACAAGDVCWDFATEAPDAEGGVCLEPCVDDADCPLGFACDELRDGDDVLIDSFCVPTGGTCSSCRDLDGDLRGVGHCGPASTPVSSVDCDDLNADAYYSVTNPGHAFPDFCGEIDLNCNGVSDASEQVGADVYPVAHCTACYDVCDGIEPDATLQCLTDGDTGQPACTVVCDDPTTHANCTDAPGCETLVTDPTRLYYRDSDNDGAGIDCDVQDCGPDDVVFACDPEEVPPGYVSNDADCDDNDQPTVYGAYGVTPAATEVCDGRDNDCNTLEDDGVATVGDDCPSGEPGICGPGTVVCNGIDGLDCEPNIEPGTQAEVCDGLDNDCDPDSPDGADEAVPAIGDDCVADAFGVCAAGTRVCQGGPELFCEPGPPSPGTDWPDADGLDNDCDGLDGRVVSAIFVSPGGIDTQPGFIDRPVRTLSRALELRDAIRNQIIMESGVYEVSEALRVSEFEDLSINGGYSRDGDDNWVRVAAPAVYQVRVPGVDGDALGLHFDVWNSSVRLGDITIDVATLGGAGQGVTAVLCDRCTGMDMRDVTIVASDGADGVNGSPGAPGAGGVAGNNAEEVLDGAAAVAVNCPGASSDPDLAIRGAGGDGGQGFEQGGEAGNDGWGLDAGAGGVGGGEDQGGQNGFDATYERPVPPPANGGANSGTPSSSAGSLTQGGAAGDRPRGIWRRPLASSGTAGGHGSGGGGGGGMGQPLDGAGEKVGVGFGGASGGSPGCGGGPGFSGGRGGSSIGLVLLQSNGISFENVVVEAGDGGRGGAGGAGGAGGFGGSGGMGAASDVTSNGPSGHGDSGSGGGASGGGGGGGGGGGAGGSSYCVLRDNTTSLGPGITLVPGSPGSGGSGGTGGTGGNHGNLDPDDRSPNGNDGLAGADGEALQQRVF